MEENTQSKFKKITLNQMQIKLEALARARGEARIWNKGESPVLFRIIDFNEKILKVDSIPSFNESWKNQVLLINFIFKNVDYFGKLKFSAHDGDFILFEFENDFFRHEKRDNERLLTYPHHSLYAYFKCLKKEEVDKSNVISFNSHRKNEDNEIFKDYITNRNKELNIDESLGEIRGYRILDISYVGMSFLIKESDQEIFKKDDSGEHLGFTLVFNGESFSIDKSTIVYIVDFCDPKLKQAKMFKVGVKFTANENITSKIDSLFFNSNEHDEILKEIEAFTDE